MIEDQNFNPQINDLITLNQASIFCGLSPGHLRRLLGNQKIEGIKIGSTWLTTEKAVKTYINSSPKPGPKSIKKT